jgi:hypothetical protein
MYSLVQLGILPNEKRPPSGQCSRAINDWRLKCRSHLIGPQPTHCTHVHVAYRDWLSPIFYGLPIYSTTVMHTLLHAFPAYRDIASGLGPTSRHGRSVHVHACILKYIYILGSFEHTYVALIIHHNSPGAVIDGNSLLLRPYRGEHGPKVPVTPEYIVLQRVLQNRESMSSQLK